jgi:TonB family protein
MFVSFDITEEGDVANASLDTSSGIKSWDEGAIECVRSWRYKPATLSGVPVRAHWQVRVQWSFQ